MILASALPASTPLLPSFVSTCIFLGILLFIIHKFFVFLTPPNRRLKRDTLPLPPVADVKVRLENKGTVSVVVGGSGFLGSHLTHHLIERGEEVRVVDLLKGTEKAEYIVSSILDEDKLTEAFRDAKVVYHTASILEFNRFPLAYDVNVVGTRCVLNACLRAGVTGLVYTSSQAVAMDGQHVHDGNEETRKYTQSHLTVYGTTKMIAEKMVLASNGVMGLKTVALRPPGLYGSGDRYLTKDLADPKVPLLSGDVIQDFMYIENAAHAHILAGKALLMEKSSVAGNFYYIGDKPKSNFKFSMDIMKRLGTQNKFIINKGLAYTMASILQLIFKFSGGYFTDIMFSLNFGILRTTHMHFHTSTAKAERDFGYKPLFSEEESIAKTVAYLQETSNKKQK